MTLDSWGGGVVSKLGRCQRVLGGVVMAAIVYGTAAAAVDVAEGEIANSSAVRSLPCRTS